MIIMSRQSSLNKKICHAQCISIRRVWLQNLERSQKAGIFNSAGGIKAHGAREARKNVAQIEDAFLRNFEKGIDKVMIK